MKRINVRRLTVLALVIALGFVSSCNDSPVASEYDQYIKEVGEIDAYLTAQGLTSQIDPVTGLRWVITKLGTTLPAQSLNATVDVDYIGKRFHDKFIFDQGNTKLKVLNYIQGWQTALRNIPAGSEAILFIPSYLGYGSTSDPNRPDIPGNTTLEFNIRFNSVTEPAETRQLLISEMAAIDEYLEEKTIDAVKDDTGIRYVVTFPGFGDPPSWYDKLKLKYSVKLLSDDTKVVATVDREPIDDFLSRVIDYWPGFMIGLQKIPIGGKITVYMPSTLAFGAPGARDSTGAVVVPPNTNIIVEMELIDIVN